jgi:hypothetical protein
MGCAGEFQVRCIADNIVGVGYRPISWVTGRRGFKGGGSSAVVSHISRTTSEMPRISCTRAPDRAACAPFFKERRMRFSGVHEISQEIGGVGHPSVGCWDRVQSFDGASPDRFRPTYAWANVGHPSLYRSSIWPPKGCGAGSSTIGHCYCFIYAILSAGLRGGYCFRVQGYGGSSCFSSGLSSAQ